MPAKTLFNDPQFLCRKKFTSDPWWLKQIKLHYPAQLQGARKKNLTIYSAPQCVEPAPRREFNTDKESIKDVELFPYLEHVKTTADTAILPQPPTPRRREIFSGAGVALSDYMAEWWESDTLGCVETIELNNPWYPCATCEEYKSIQRGIKIKAMKTYYDNVVTHENGTRHSPRFIDRDHVQKLVASMPDTPALRECEHHTLEYMKWNDTHQHPIKYWSSDIIKSMRWLMRQPAYAEDLIEAPQSCFNSGTPQKRLYTAMHTADWWLQPQAWRDSGRWKSDNRS